MPSVKVTSRIVICLVLLCISLVPTLGVAFSIAGESNDIAGDIGKPLSIVWSRCQFQNRSGTNFLSGPMFRKGFASLEYCFSMSRLGCRGDSCGSIDDASLPCDPLDVLPTTFTDGSTISCEDAGRTLLEAYMCRVGRGPIDNVPFSQSIRTSISAASDAIKCSDGVAGQLKLNEAIEFSLRASEDNYMEASCTSKGHNATISACSKGPYATESTFVKSTYSYVFVSEVDVGCDNGHGLAVTCSYCQPYLEAETVVQPYYFLVPPAIKMTIMVFFDLFIIDRLSRRVRRRVQRYNREKAAPRRDHNDVFVQFIIKYLLKGGAYRIGLKRTSASLDGLRNLKKLRAIFDKLVEKWQKKRKVTLEIEMKEKKALRKQAKKQIRNQRKGLVNKNEPISLPDEINPEDDSELTAIEAVSTDRSQFEVEREIAHQRKRDQEAKRRRIEKRLAKGKHIDDIQTDDCSTSDSDKEYEAALNAYTLNDITAGVEKVIPDGGWEKYTDPIKGINLRKALYNRQTIVGTYRHIMSRMFAQMGITSLDSTQEKLVDHELEWFWNEVCNRGERIFDGLESSWGFAFRRHWSIMCRPQVKYHIAHDTEDIDDDVDVVMYYVPAEDDHFTNKREEGPGHRSGYVGCHNNFNQTEYVVSCEEDDHFVSVVANLYLLLVDEDKIPEVDPDDIQVILLDGSVLRVDYSMKVKDIRDAQMKVLEQRASDDDSVPLAEFKRCPRQFLPLRFNVVTEGDARQSSFPPYYHLPSGFYLYQARNEFIENAAFSFPMYEKDSLVDVTDQALAKLLDGQFSKLAADRMLMLAGEEEIFDYLVSNRYVYRDAIPEILALSHESKANALGVSTEDSMGHAHANGVVQLNDDSNKADTLCCLEILLISKSHAEVKAEEEAASRAASPVTVAPVPVDSSVRKGAFGIVDEEDPETIMAKNLSDYMKGHFNQINDTIVTIYDTTWLDEQRKAQRRITVIDPPTPIRPAIFIDGAAKIGHITPAAAATVKKSAPVDEEVDAKVSRAMVQQQEAASVLSLVEMRESESSVARVIYNEVYEELSTITQLIDGEKRQGMHLVYTEDRDAFLKTLSDLYTAVTIRLAESGGDKTCVSSHHLANEYRDQIESLSVLMPIVTKEEQVTYAIFYVNVYMLIIEVIFGLVFLGTCINASYSALAEDDDNWSLYESIFFKFLNSGTPSTLISSTLTNYIVNAPNRLKSYYYKIIDTGLVLIAFLLFLPALITHCLAGFVLYIWIFIIIFMITLIPNVIIWMMYRRLRVSWTDDSVEPKKRLRNHQRLKMIFTGILIWFNFVVVVILTGLTQSTFNWAHLYYRHKEMGLGYETVLAYEWESRSPACYLERQMTGVSNILQFLSSFV